MSWLVAVPQYVDSKALRLGYEITRYKDSDAVNGKTLHEQAITNINDNIFTKNILRYYLGLHIRNGKPLASKPSYPSKESIIAL